MLSYRYRVTVYGRNIVDERERKVAGIGGPTARGWYNERATYGVELSALATDRTWS